MHRGTNFSTVKDKVLYGKEFDSISFLTLLSAIDIHLIRCVAAVIEVDYSGVLSMVVRGRAFS